MPGDLRLQSEIVALEKRVAALELLLAELQSALREQEARQRADVETVVNGASR